MPHRSNVQFFADAAEAEAAGYRPCKRCLPQLEQRVLPSVHTVIQSCRFIESCDQPPSLHAIAENVGFSPEHVHRLFKKSIGVSPRDFASQTRLQRLVTLLQSDDSLLGAIYAAGYESPSRCYTDAPSLLGMPPGRFRKGGPGESIAFGTACCSLGALLVAATDQGICRISIGDDPSTLIADLNSTFHAAVTVCRDADFDLIVAAVVSLIDDSSPRHAFPLDIRGTAFQRQVWRALQSVPAGKTVTYRQLAKAIGRPSAVRAVASACGANQLAVAIPCHRVVRSDGKVGRYRWGIDRKRQLLAKERAGEQNAIRIRNEDGDDPAGPAGSRTKWSAD